ncbi:MAG: helix-turn-helix domain-containing protein [Cyclobacteriaceae bacterium]
MSRSHKLERAEIILHSSEGLTLDKMVALTGKSRPVVNKWRKRFRQQRMAGLQDAPGVDTPGVDTPGVDTPRSGKPRTITAAQKADGHLQR